MQKYQKLNPIKLGLTAGIIGAILTFLTTLNGIYGKSKISEFMVSSMWGTLGYNVSWGGAFLGTALGFIYAFIIIWIAGTIYNKLL
ncbi:hypothetical protein HN832_01210 [archaeon]|jgi:hypothetical protein|nr:hypothetical protein [archaeon]MBT4373891.1 hypothetical protein [archaeon]MBT4532168.1 hypothetical protein [archaeon]MBT7001121.1 hypothetical protein [archaeon]MBT7282010.1 hypothetical protein [archaeon]